MTVRNIMLAAASLATIAAAASPAAAQNYPGYQNHPNAYPNNGAGVVGAIINSVTGNTGYNNNVYGAYGQSADRQAIDQCARAAEARVNQQYGSRGGYGGGYQGQGYDPRYGNHGYAAIGSARLAGVTQVERRNNGLRVSGVIDSGLRRGAYGQDPRYGNNGYGQQYGQGYGQANQAYVDPRTADVSFTCRVDYRGVVTKVNINRNNAAYRQGY